MITVNGEGELEAKKSFVLQTPRVWPAPTISYLAPEGTQVKKDDIVVKFEADQVKKEYKNAIEELEIAKAEAKKKNAELTLQRLLYDSQKNSAEASAAASKLQLAKLEFESPRNQEIKKLEISQQELEAERARKKLVSLEKIQIEERAHSQMRIKQAENKLNRSQMHLDKLILKASSDGIVVHETNWIKDQKVKEGDALYPGMVVVKIPDLSVMQAKLQIGETEAQKVKKGQQAIVTVPSIGTFQFPGKVTKVANIAKPIKRGSKVKKVEVIVEIDSTRQGIVPGLTASSSIIITEIENAIAVPHECVFEKDSVKIVYVLEKSHYVPHAIAIANQDADFCIIISDLDGDEKLALREPAASQINFPDSLITPELPEKEEISETVSAKDTLKQNEKKIQILKMIKNN